jgi:hypothetical protein
MQNFKRSWKKTGLRCLAALGLMSLTATVPADDLTDAWAFDRPALSVLRQSPRKVFAHYFTSFPLSIDNKPAEQDYYTVHYLNPKGEKGKFEAVGGLLRERPLPRAPRQEANWQLSDMKEEVRRAVALGLDGFVCDILDYQGYHFERVKLLLEAADQVDPGFKIVLMPDMYARFKGQPERLTETIRTLAAYPAVYRLSDNRVVVSPFNAQMENAAWWKSWIKATETADLKIAFVPTFQQWSKYAAEFAPISAGMSDWGSRSPGAQAAWRTMPGKARQFTRLWMAAVSPQDMRPRSRVFTESGNSDVFRLMWKNAIEGKADWVQMVTWNDYSEGTEIAPSTKTQFAFYDLTAYYTTWFKTGQPPKITKDVLYYFHRVQSTDVEARKTTPEARLKLSRGSDAPRNEIELLAFLTQPGTLEIELNGQKRRKSAEAGITSFKIPLESGRPTFRLLRQGRAAVTIRSAFEITDDTEYQNLLYHAGSSSRPPVTPPSAAPAE